MCIRDRASAAIAALAFALMRWGGEAVIPFFLQKGDTALLQMSLKAMELYSLSYVTSWLGISLGSFFTAVNRPGISLGISTGRALFFPLASLALFVSLWGIDGVWLTPAVSCTLTAVSYTHLPAAVTFSQQCRQSPQQPQSA